MNNTYGNVKSAVIDPIKDVEIFYHYRPTLNSEDISYRDFKKIDDVSSVFTTVNISSTSTNSNNQMFPDSVLPGIYNLSLPVKIFGKKGFYTIFIRPREIYCTIKDVGALGAYPDISGIIIDMNDIDEDKTLFGNDNLTGYRVEYLQYENGGLKRQDYYRLITSCNCAEPITQNLTSANTNSNAYRFNESGTLSFITLTPSIGPSFKANAKPYIGSPNQQIIISNTKFDPVCLRIEICENDFDTLATSIDGNQIRALDNGLLTTYNKDLEIYKQWEFYSLKDNYNKNVRYEVKRERTDNIDNSVDANDVFQQ
jgi:hypothetical protein